jgi:hypothetical protein
MTNFRQTIQIIPSPPGPRDGVGDYARTLARRLRESHRIDSTFVTGAPYAGEVLPDGFTVLSPWRAVISKLNTFDEAPIILHYVNYAYERRGVPLWLPRTLHETKARRRLLTIFHELYAAGSFRQSAFWLGPLQMRIARLAAEMSDVALVSSDFYRQQLHRFSPTTPIVSHPVFSNFGEPDLSPTDMTARDPHRWVICGGTQLLERSLASFAEIVHRLSGPEAPRQLVVIGGTETPAIKLALRNLATIKVTHYPDVQVSTASELLAGCTFGWIDYFVQTDIPLSAILKSGAFAALCAHGVIPVLPRVGEIVTVQGDSLAGPFFVDRSTQSLPDESQRSETAWAIYCWYRRNAVSASLAQTVESALFPD